MEGEVRILPWTKGNLETKYCGEVIGDGVQLWTKTGDVSEPNVTGEKTWPELNLKPENKTKKNTCSHLKVSLSVRSG